MGDILWQQDVERERKAKEKSLKYQRTAKINFYLAAKVPDCEQSVAGAG